MTKEQFESVLRVPTCSRHEDMMQEFLLDWAGKHGYSAKKDSKGNILMSKGQTGPGKYAVGLINHIDTVHHDQEEMVKQHVYKEIVWEGDKVTAINPLLPKRSSSGYGWSTSSWSFDRKDDKKSVKQPSLFDKDSAIEVKQGPDGTYYEIKDEKPEEKTGGNPGEKDGKKEEKTPGEKKEKKEEKKEEKPVEMGRQTGLGMDNQGGCAIALAVMEDLPVCRAAFTVEEEIGMLGARAMDMHFFDDCAFVFSNDSPDRNRGTHYSSGVQLYSDEFFKEHLQKICADHGLTDFRSEPFTCILNVRNHALPDGKHLECLNFGNGGYNAHMDTEYAKFSDVCAAEDLLRALCTKIPLDKQYSSGIKPEARSWGGYGGSYSGYGSYGGYGGYGSYGGYRSRGDDDDDSWWNSLLDRKGGGKRDGRPDDDRSGAFTFKFKNSDFASTAVIRLSRFESSSRDFSFGRTKNTITAEGRLLALKYAYMICFNAENQTSYAEWGKFVKSVPGAEAAFMSIVTFDDEDDGEDGKMSHGPDDECTLNIYLTAEDGDVFREMLETGALKDVDLDVDTDSAGWFTVSGRLEDVKKAWAGATAVEVGGEFREFKDLDADLQEDFWDEVEFEDASSGGGRKENGPAGGDDQPDDDDLPDDAADFWNWWDSRHDGKDAGN